MRGGTERKGCLLTSCSALWFLCESQRLCGELRMAKEASEYAKVGHIPSFLLFSPLCAFCGSQRLWGELRMAKKATSEYAKGWPHSFLSIVFTALCFLCGSQRLCGELRMAKKAAAEHPEGSASTNHCVSSSVWFGAGLKQIHI